MPGGGGHGGDDEGVCPLPRTPSRCAALHILPRSPGGLRGVRIFGRPPHPLRSLARVVRTPAPPTHAQARLSPAPLSSAPLRCFPSLVSRHLAQMRSMGRRGRRRGRASPGSRPPFSPPGLLQQTCPSPQAAPAAAPRRHTRPTPCPTIPSCTRGPWWWRPSWAGATPRRPTACSTTRGRGSRTCTSE